MIYSRRENHMAEGFSSIITQLEQQKAAIDKALAALHGLDGAIPAHAGASAARKHHGMSPEGKRRLVAALKRRWAAKRAAAGVVAPVAKPAKSKGGMTPAGRKRLADAMRKRWAAKRTAAQAKKSARKKAA
jgi:hypothetical protein